MRYVGSVQLTGCPARSASKKGTWLLPPHLSEAARCASTEDHQHVQDVLVGQVCDKELGLGHYKILATITGDRVAGTVEQNTCKL
jgi:hypothetical protein